MLVIRGAHIRGGLYSGGGFGLSSGFYGISIWMAKKPLYWDQHSMM